MADARNVEAVGSTGKRSARIASKGRAAATGVAKTGRKLKPVRKDSTLNDKMRPHNELGGQGRR